jgi:hypothetical protein
MEPDLAGSDNDDLQIIPLRNGSRTGIYSFDLEDRKQSDHPEHIPGSLYWHV